MSSQDPPVNRRPDGRDYGCPCGKFYLSVAALYGHIKIKHDGHAPGPLIKPKSKRKRYIRRYVPGSAEGEEKGEQEKLGEQADKYKWRGRGRSFCSIHINQDDSDQDCPLKDPESVRKMLQSLSVKTDVAFQSSNGQKTCQDMASKFIEQLGSSDNESLKVAKYYINLLKKYIEQNKEPHYWETQPPDQIVFLANEFSRNFSSKDQEMKREAVVDMTYLLCRWMYKRKWTNNKLIKRTPPTVVFKKLL